MVTNAIKFSNENAMINVGIQKENDALIVAIIDNGQGIPEDEVAGVFGEFQRTSTRPTGGERSTGLGLAICKKIIASHNGSIHVKSKLKEGSTFYFKLPLAAKFN